MIVKYFIEGFNAYDRGDMDDENPYTSGSAPHKSWDMGWHDAWYQNTMIGNKQ